VLEEDDNNTFTSPAVVHSGAATSKAMSGQPAGTWYYRVKAVGVCDSAWSALQSVVVATLPTAPTLDVISNPDFDGSFAVSWSAVAGATSYVLEEDNNAGFTSPTQVYSGAPASANVTGRPDGTYYYRVKAVNCLGASPWSNVQSVAVAFTFCPRDLRGYVYQGTFGVSAAPAVALAYCSTARPLRDCSAPI